MSTRLVTRALEPTGVRGDDYAVYSYLLFGPMTLTALAEGLGMPLTTAAGYVKRFEARGDVIKTPNPADGRSRLLSLTDECRAEILAVAKVFTQTVDRFSEVMDEHGVNSDHLIDQLQLMHDLLGHALATLDADTSSAQTAE